MPSYERKWPQGAVLRCACGKEFSVNQMNGHRRMSTEPGCRSSEPLVARVIRPGRFPAPSVAHAAKQSGDVLEEHVPRGALTVTEPPPLEAEEGNGHSPPAPPMVSGTMRLPIKAWAYLSAVRADPRFSFDGSMAELVMEVFDQFFAGLGLSEPQLVDLRDQPVLAEVQ